MIATSCLLAATAVLAVFAGGASGGFTLYADCWYSSSTGKLTVKTKNSEEATIRRRGKRIDVLAPGRTRCNGGRPTVRNTDRMRFVLRGGGLTEGHVALAGGQFAPGRSPEEAGAPEIEIRVWVPRSIATLHIDGTQGADRFRGGDLGRAQGVNLNPRAEMLAPDADLRLRGPGASTVWFGLGRGDDVLDLGGGPEFRGPMRTRWVIALLGKGSDEYTGSRRRDFVIAGEGADEVSTGPGADLINVNDGRAETVDCGDGHDRIHPDQADIYVNCEELGFVGFVD